MPSYESGSAKEAPFDVQFDASSGSVRIVVRNFWSEEISQNFLRRLQMVTSIARTRAPNLKVLVDATMMNVHTSSAVEEYTEVEATLYRAGDRIAVVTKSALVKLQFRRFFNSAETEYFDMPQQAETWLQSKP